MYLQAFLTYKNLLAKLKLQYAHLLKFLVKNAKFVKRILNPSFNFKFNSISIFTQTTKNIEYRPKFRLPKGPKNNVLKFMFICSHIFRLIWEMTKTSTKLIIFVIGIHKLFCHNLWLWFITILTIVNLAFSSTFGFHAQTLVAILKVNFQDTFSSCVWLKRRAKLKFSKRLKPEQPGNMEIRCPD